MANKNSVNVQLNINTAFKNVKQAVDSLKKELSNINISGSLGNDLIDNFQKQAAQIKQTLSQVGNFDFSTGDTKEYSKLVQQLKNEYASLNSMVKQYSDTFISTTQKNIAKQTEAIAAQKKQKEAYDAELNSLLQGKAAYDALQSGSSDLTAKEKELAATYEQNIPRINELNSEIKSLSKSMAGHKSELTKNEAALKAYNQVLEVENQQSKVIKNEIEQVINSRKNEVVQIKETEAAQKSAIAQQQKATQEEERQAKAKDELTLISSSFVKQMTKEAETNDKLTQSIETSILKWTSFTTIINVAQRAITDIIHTYQELDDNLSAISAVSGISTQQLWGDMPSMIDNANELALSVDDLTNGMLLFYQQGLNAEDTEIRLEAAGKMAAISQQDLATAVDQLTSAMNAFNMTSDQAQNVVDVYAALAGATAVDVQELAAAMSRTASIAQNAGLTFEQTAAFLTTMEETTRLSSETIGNSFKSIIARFTQLRTSTEALEDGVDANKVETALKTAGVALRDANGEFRDLGEVLMELSSKWDTLDSNTQKYIATTAAGTQQQSNFIALISQYQANMDNLATATNSAGASQEQFEAISNNLSSAIIRLENSLTAIKTSWLEGTSALSGFVDILAYLLQVISKIPAPIQAITVALTAFIAKQIASELASQRLTIQETKEFAAKKMLETVEKSSLKSSEQLAIVKDLLKAKSEGLTTAELMHLTTLQKLNPEEKKSIATTYAQVTANEAVTFSFGTLRASVLKAATALKALATAHPILLTIGIALGVLVTAAGAFSKKAEEAKQKTQELNDAISQLNQSASESQNISDSLDGYIEQLKKAHSAGEDLTSIREEIQKSGYLEGTGVDALTSKYDNLLDTLQEVSSEQSKQASITRGQALSKQAELNRQKDQEALKNTSQSVSTRFIDKQGNDVTSDIRNYQPKEENETEAEYVERISKVFEVQYAVYVNGKLQTYDTRDAAQQALDQANEDYTPSESYSTSEAQDIVNSIEDVNQTFFSALGISGDNAVSLVKIWGNKIGQAVLDESGNISSDFDNFISIIGQSISENGNQLNITTEQIYDYLSGNFESLNSNTVSLIQEGLNNSINQLDGEQKSQLQEFSQAAEENYQKTLQQLSEKLTSNDYQIIDETTAQKIGIQGLQILEDTLEQQGANSAQALGKVFSEIISQGISDTDLESVMSQLNDAFSDLDVSDVNSVANVTEQLQSLADQGIITSDQLTALLNTFGEYNKAIGLLTSSTNQASSQVEFFDQALGDGYNTFEEMQQAASAAGLSIEEIGAHIDSTTGKWMASKDAVHNYAVELGNASAAEANAILAKAALENQSLANAIAMDNEAIASNGLTTAEVGNAIIALQSEKEKAKADVDAAQAAVESAKTQLEAAKANAAAVEGSVNSQAENQKIAVNNTSKMGQAIQSIIQGLVNAWPALGKFFGGFSDAIGAAAADTIESAKSSADAVAAAQANLDSANENLTAAQDHLNQIDQGINILESYKNAINGATNGLKNYGQAADGAGGSGGSAADGANEATEALEAQKEALQKVIDQWEDYKSELEDSKQALEDQKSALENLNDKLKDNLELYLDLIKTRLEDEIDKQTTAVESFYDAIKDTIQKEIDAFDKNLDELNKKADELQDKADKLQEEAEKQEDSLNKLYDAVTSYYDAVQSGIENEINLQDDAIEKNEYKISLLEDQKDAIQEQIDNLDTAADSESKLLALEKARDALANARNQKTRMVLTNGGGWRLKTDTSAVQEAQSNLADAERDYQKELLERQQDKLDEQISQLKEENDKIEDIQDSLEAQNDLIDNIKQDWDDAAENLGKTTSEIEEQTRLLQMIASSNDAQRQDLLTGFQSNIAQNNNQYQNAADASNAAEEASNRYDYQNNADNQDSIAAAIEALKEQQNLADESMKEYFENILSNNAEEVAISQQMQALVGQLIQNGNGSLESFSQFRDQVNGAFDAANEFAANQAEYINRINEVIAYYEEWSNRLDMTSEEINQRQQIMNEINNATLSSLLEGGSTFNQLEGQYNEIIRNNDEAVKIQGQIDDLDAQIDDVQAKIDELKKQQDLISEQEKALSNANTDKNTSATKSAGSGVSNSVKSSGAGIEKAISSAANQVSSAVQSANKNITVTVNGGGGGSGASKPTIAAMRSKGGPVGFSTGGVDDFTSMVAVHGTKNRPELVLNNSQSAALFKYIDSMTRIPTLSSAGSARNALQAFNTTNNTTNEGTSFTGCEFNIESNANNLDSLVKELRQSSSIRRK